jgi:hypothetical protein
VTAPSVLSNAALKNASTSKWLPAEPGIRMD